MTSSFTAVPVIDFGRLENAETKARALSDLRDAIFRVGFLYLTNTGLEALVSEAHGVAQTIFQLPHETKESCHMRNSPSFLGYTGLHEETTAAKIDMREQFDFGTEVTDPPVDGAAWRKLEGKGQYPNPEIEAFIKRYVQAMTQLSCSFLHHVAECLSLPQNTFDRFVGNMSRMKMVRYPPSKPGTQGVGPHKDSLSLFTFLSQDHVGGLQVLNKAGQWIDAPPIAGSFVVNIAQGFEAITGGLCPATPHRVESPTGATRYSIPFFQAIKLDLTFEEIQRSAATIADSIPTLEGQKRQDVEVPSDIISPEFSTIGEAQLRNRIMSHPEVGEKWYCDLFQKYTTGTQHC